MSRSQATRRTFMESIVRIPSVTGVDVELKIAGPGGRSYAFVIDWHIRFLAAVAWFLGGNDLTLPLVDLETGSCRDGLHRDRLNENRGGESAVSYLLSLADMRQLDRANQDGATRAPLHALRA